MNELVRFSDDPIFRGRGSRDYTIVRSEFWKEQVHKKTLVQRPAFFLDHQIIGQSENRTIYKCITSPYAAAAASITASDIVGCG